MDGHLHPEIRAGSLVIMTTLACMYVCMYVCVISRLLQVDINLVMNAGGVTVAPVVKDVSSKGEGHTHSLTYIHTYIHTYIRPLSPAWPVSRSVGDCERVVESGGNALLRYAGSGRHAHRNIHHTQPRSG